MGYNKEKAFDGRKVALKHSTEFKSSGNRCLHCRLKAAPDPFFQLGLVTLKLAVKKKFGTSFFKNLGIYLRAFLILANNKKIKTFQIPKTSDLSPLHSLQYPLFFLSH